MNQILELREKRAKRGTPPKRSSTASAARTACSPPWTPRPTTGWRPTWSISARRSNGSNVRPPIDRELDQPLGKPITERPGAVGDQGKTGRATDEYKARFLAHHARQVRAARGTQCPAGRRGNQRAAISRRMNTSTRSSKRWRNRTSSDSLPCDPHLFRRPQDPRRGLQGHGQLDRRGSGVPRERRFLRAGLHRGLQANTRSSVKVSEELLNDSVFDLPSYIAREFARRIGAAEEDAFFNGNGTGKPLGILAATGGAETGVTAASATAITMDEIMDLYYSLRAPYRRNAVFLMNDSTVKGHPQAEEWQWRLPLAAFGDGGYARYAAQPPGLHLQLHARHRRRQQGHPFWRPRLLLGRRPRGAVPSNA